MNVSPTFKTTAVFLLISTFTALTALGQQTKAFPIQNFNEISVASGIDLYLTQGSTESVKLKTGEEIFKNLVVEKNGNHLTIKYKDNNSWQRMFQGQKIVAYVTCKNLNGLFASGGSDVFSQNTINTDQLTVHSSGGSNVKLNLTAKDVDLQSSGGSDINIKGKATNLIIQSSGGSDINAFEFMVENARVNSSGGSDVNIHVTKALETHASGGSDISFKGDAALKNSSSKSGQVRRLR
jgi:hypothetical protein